MKEKLEEVFKEFQKNAKVRGFRPGKVPRRVIESIYGRQIFNEVSTRLVSDSFKKRSRKFLLLQFPARV